MEDVRRETLDLVKRMLTHVDQRIEESKAHLQLRARAAEACAQTDHEPGPEL